MYGAQVNVNKRKRKKKAERIVCNGNFFAHSDPKDLYKINVQSSMYNYFH